MEIYTEIGPCRDAAVRARSSGRKVALVPTMGALHEGHLALLRAARQMADYVAVSIFVNPKQFAPGEDFNAYPRTLDDDLAKCRAAGVDVVFAPGVEAMYGQGPLTTVHVGRISEGLCGRFRPGHFDGVATVVAKLFNILAADVAIFGEKDYQQLVVIRWMVRDLNIPIEIVAHATVREPDGLAISSRNRYLSPSERRQAASLSAALFAAVDGVRGGQKDAHVLTDKIREELTVAGPVQIEYVEVVDLETLAPVAIVDRPARICLAVRIGACRLIDNVAVDAPDFRG